MTGDSPDRNDIIRILGPVSDYSAARILALRPSWSEVDIVAAYLAGETDIMGEKRKPLTGTPATILDIVQRDELLEEETGRRG